MGYSRRVRSRARSNEGDWGDLAARGNAQGQRNANRGGFVNSRDTRWSCDRYGIDQHENIDQRWSMNRECRPGLVL